MKLLTIVIVVALMGLLAIGTVIPVHAGYHLFNPVPKSQMRGLSADRPDATESPYTVDPGHIQLEISAVDLSGDKSGGAEITAQTFVDANIKLGLLANVDLQIVVQAFTKLEADVPGAATQTIDGFGDIIARVKVNLWGNDEGVTAFALMPYVKVPTGTDLSNDELEGGAIASLGWDAWERAGLGFQLEAASVWDDSKLDRGVELSHTTVLGLDVGGPVGVYIEYVGVVPAESAIDYLAIASFGATLEVTPDLLLDVGTQLGISEDADDYRAFAGGTIRF